MRVASTGRPCTDAAKQKLREFHTGITLPVEERAQIVASLELPQRPKPEPKRVVNTAAYKTEEFRQAASKRFAGVPKPETTRAKHRERMANEPAEVKERRLAALRAVTQARWAKWRAEKESQCN
jgi:hypothetical protein